MTTTQIRIEGGNTVAGNAVGFMADGTVVSIRRRSRQQAYKVCVGDGLVNTLSETFRSLTEAKHYAGKLVDVAATLRLAWWTVRTIVQPDLNAMS